MSSVAIATKATVKKWIEDPQTVKYLSRILPKELDPAKVLQIYYNVVATTPQLQDCTTTSLMKVILFGSQLGLSFDPNLRQAWIVAYGKEATLIVGYKGLEKLVIQSGYADAIDAVTVYENDDFEIEEGQTPRLYHRPRFAEPRGARIGVYARAFRADGTIRFRFTPMSEIERHRNAGASKNSPAWKNWEEEMGEKTAIRILCKRLPQSEKTINLHRLVTADEMAEADPAKQSRSLVDADPAIDVDFEDVERPTKTSTVAAKLKVAKGESDRTALLLELSALQQQVYSNPAEAEVAASEATGGKVQTIKEIETASIKDLENIIAHAKGIRDGASVIEREVEGAGV